MFTFKKVELTDATLLSSVFEHYKGQICDYSLGNVLFWREYYDTSYYLGDDGFILKFGNMNGTVCYSYPIASDPIALMDKLSAETDGTICFTLMTEEEFNSLPSRYKSAEIIYSRDWDDYLYSAEDIITLKGRRFSGQRNHINKFKKLYKDAHFEIITPDSLTLAKNFCRDYFGGIGKETEVSGYEKKQLEEQLDNWEVYKQVGGLLMVGDKVIGISVGEVVGDMLIVHTEKADTSYCGAYPMLVNCFAKEFAHNCLYINREEDCGEEGLRISKNSYHPIKLIKKYSINL